jgi:hypothetical protein
MITRHYSVQEVSAKAKDLYQSVNILLDIFFEAAELLLTLFRRCKIQPKLYFIFCSN